MYLLETCSYALDLIADAQDYSCHASRSDVNTSDLLLAAEMRDDSGSSSAGAASTLPDPHHIFALAEEVNRIPLPPIPPSCYNGVVLPPEEHQLMARTFDVVTSSRVAQRMARGGPVPPPNVFGGLAGAVVSAGSGIQGMGSEKGRGSKRKKASGTYGASQGRQIAVKLKSSEGLSDGPAVGGGGTLDTTPKAGASLTGTDAPSSTAAATTTGAGLAPNQLVAPPASLSATSSSSLVGSAPTIPGGPGLSSGPPS